MATLAIFRPRRIAAGGDLADERLFNLKRVDVKFSQGAQAGVTGAKVIHREPPHFLIGQPRRAPKRTARSEEQ
jgi:hypothetical protein